MKSDLGPAPLIKSAWSLGPQNLPNFYWGNAIAIGSHQHSTKLCGITWIAGVALHGLLVWPYMECWYDGLSELKALALRGHTSIPCKATPAFHVMPHQHSTKHATPAFHIVMPHSFVECWCGPIVITSLNRGALSVSYFSFL